MSDFSAILESDKAPAVPAKECDLVMKGGTASGVVYGAVVQEIAAEYRLRNISGTSAGAVAAVVAAGAEYWRQKNKDAGTRKTAGFGFLPSIDDELEEKGVKSFFQAQPRFAWLLDAFNALDKDKFWDGIPHMLARLVWGRKYVNGAIIAIGAFWIYAACRDGNSQAAWLAFILTVLAFVVSTALLTGLAILSLRHHGYGLCTGMSAGADPANPAITEWLHDKIQAAAGRTGGPVLTVGELAETGVDIGLQTMTTDLCSVRPYRTPLGDEYHYSQNRAARPARRR
ncbi:MAG: hypothetical protein AAFU55_05945, partial [Pseudomonadota bacterium]